MDVTYWACERESQLRTVPIGRPIANTQILYPGSGISNRCQSACPANCTSAEIGLARGYHNRPELTAEKFIPNPFESEPGARLYKTGDLARLPARRSHRVSGTPGSPSEDLRASGSSWAKSNRCWRASRGAGGGGAGARGRSRRQATGGLPDCQRTENRRIDSELRGLLRAKLPEYMIPSAFVILDRLPLTPNGKVDRKALPRPDLQSSNPAEFAPPVTETEKAWRTSGAKFLEWSVWDCTTTSSSWAATRCSQFASLAKSIRRSTCI